MRNKIVDAAEAVAIIRSGDTVASSGFVGVGTPDEIIKALERRFVQTGEPRDLSLVFAAAPGDGADRGLNRLAHPGLIKRLVGGHFGLVPKLARMAVDNHVEAYNLPLGCVSHLFREIAGRKAGLLSKVGLGTFVDPANGGGKLNARTTEELVRLIEIDGEQWLFYKAFPINVAIIRGTTADHNGNISMEKEALTLDNLALATAAKNCKGFVIAQVERIAASGSLNPRHVKIPSVLIDCVVVAQPENHVQTYATGYNGAFSGELRAPADRNVPMPLDNRKIIARRCALELPMGGVVNLGIGMPEGIASVAAEEKLFDFVTLTAEPGIIGGIPQGGLDFGAAINAESIIDQNQMFDFYDGGGLDLACLGMAQVNGRGDVNVSLFNGRLAGAGGFINISQNARRLIFAGTFTTGGLKTSVVDGQLKILSEGKSSKFIDKVDQITFSGKLAATNKQPVHLCDRTMCVQACPGRPRTDRDRAGYRHGAGHSRAHGFSAHHPLAESHGCVALQRSADAAGRPASQPAAGGAAVVRCRSQHAVPRSRRISRPYRGRRRGHPGCHPRSLPSRRAPLFRGHQLRFVRHRVPHGGQMVFDGRRHRANLLRPCLALHHQRIHAPEARRRPVSPRRRSAYFRNVGRRPPVCRIDRWS